MQSKYTATTQQLHSSRAWRSAGPKWRRPPHPQPHLHPHPTPSRWRSSSRSSSVSAASRAASAPRRQPRAACRPSACLSRARPSRGWAACFRGPARDFPRRLAATRRALERPCVPKSRSCVLRARLGEQGPGRGRASPGVWGARWVRTPGRTPTTCIGVCIRESVHVCCARDPVQCLFSHVVRGRLASLHCMDLWSGAQCDTARAVTRGRPPAPRASSA